MQKGILYSLIPNFEGLCLSPASVVFQCSTMSIHNPVLAPSPGLSSLFLLPSLPPLLQAGPGPATTHSDSLITIDKPKWGSTSPS